MKVSFLVAAAILCSLGCSYGEFELKPCTLFPGYLYIFNMSTKTRDGEEGDGWTYEIRGSSGPPPKSKIEHYASSVGEATVLELDKIEVYDCLASIKAAQGFLQNFMPNAFTDSKDNSKLSLDVQTLQTAQLLDTIKDAVALWTDNGWVRICNCKPDHVYVLQMSTQFPDKECVYMIKGSSEITPDEEIIRISKGKLQIFELYWCPVSNCEQAIRSIFSEFDILSKHYSGVSNTTPYGEHTISVSATLNKLLQLFDKNVKAAISNFKRKIPPTDCYSVGGEHEPGNVSV